MKIGRGAPILLLDDNESDRKIISACFKKTGYENEIKLFESSDSLLNDLAEIEKGNGVFPEILLLDVNMPEMDGFEVLLKIRTMPLFKKLPIAFFLTSSSAPEDRARAESLGCQNFFTKAGGIKGYLKIFEELKQIVKSNEII